MPKLSARLSMRSIFCSVSLKPTSLKCSPKDVYKRQRLACVMETGKVVAASTWCFDFDREPEAVRVNAESQGAVVQEILTGWGFSS